MTPAQRIGALFMMLFCHVVDDYYLQGILAQMKQRKWWIDQCATNYDKACFNESMYRNDYKVALLVHAFSWAFSISVPLLIAALMSHNDALLMVCIGSYFVNTPLHAYIDDLKANKHAINLVMDQGCHLVQIIGTWMVAFL